MKKIITFFTILFTILTFSQVNLDYQLHEFYEDVSGYENTFKTQYQYDENNHLILLEHLSWDDYDSVYVNDSKSLYSYDENGNKIESLLYYWNGMEYALEEKEIFTYNTNNNLIQKEVFFWNGAEYEPDNKTVFNYNLNNKLSEYTSLSWDGTAFFIEGKSTATFNAEGILESFINEVGSEVTPLKLHSKEVFTHNSNAKIVERVLYLWDDIDEIYLPDNKKTYNLDSNNNLISSIEYEYDEEFIPLYKYEYVYDFTQLQNSFIHPFDVSNIEFSYLSDNLDFTYLQDSPFYNKVLEKIILEYDDYDEIFINESRYVYHYNETTSSIKDINTNSISIYPNPTKDKIYIKTNDNTSINKLTLYDNTGRIIINTTLNVMHLKLLDSGIYTLIIVNNNGNSFNKKIIKQ